MGHRQVPRLRTGTAQRGARAADATPRRPASELKGCRVVPGLLDLVEAGGGPLGEAAEQQGEAAVQGADLVLNSGRDLGMVRAHDQAVAFELAQPVGYL